jgi:hypothetical protein
MKDSTEIRLMPCQQLKRLICSNDFLPPLARQPISKPAPSFTIVKISVNAARILIKNTFLIDLFLKFIHFFNQEYF